MVHLIKGLFYRLSCVAVGGFATAAGLAFSTTSASAQAAYGSYVGVGPTIGFTDGPQDNGRQIGGVLAVRYKLLETPVSFRAQALIGSGTAVVPTISYDVPLNWQTDAYLGAGVAFASGDSPSPVGIKPALHCNRVWIILFQTATPFFLAMRLLLSMPIAMVEEQLFPSKVVSV
jgi:hypothetical protein